MCNNGECGVTDYFTRGGIYFGKKRYGIVDRRKHLPERQTSETREESGDCQFISESSLNCLQKQQDKGESVAIYGINAYEFMMVDMDVVMADFQTKSERQVVENLITPERLRTMLAKEKEQMKIQKRMEYE